jgi:hypothetical protein
MQDSSNAAMTVAISAVRPLFSCFPATVDTLSAHVVALI